MRSLVLGGVLAVALAGAAQATPIKWDFQDASADGSTLIGSFVFDADTNVYSNVSFEVSGGGLINATYTNIFFSDNTTFAATTVAQPDLNGLPFFSVEFAPL